MPFTLRRLYRYYDIIYDVMINYSDNGQPYFHSFFSKIFVRNGNIATVDNVNPGKMERKRERRIQLNGTFALESIATLSL